MIAGIDFGSTLIKTVWKPDCESDDFRYASTRTYSLDEIIKNLKDDGVTKLNMAGIHYKGEAFPGFELISKKGDPIQNEINMQAAGTKKLLELDGLYLPEFLIASIGTGTSYTSVREQGKKANHFPIGNSVSGGFILGLGKCFGAKSFEKIVSHARKGKPADLLIKDLLPESPAPQREYVIANFGKEARTLDDAYATIISTVATATIKDILAMSLHPEFNHSDIIYTGSSVQHNAVLRQYLDDMTRRFGKTPHFPRKCAYALAMGAYLDGEAEI